VPQLFSDFVHTHPEFDIYFVNDASSDTTESVLNSIRDGARDHIELINAPQHLGKGEAIRLAVQRIISKNAYDCFGYLDADLATSLASFHKLQTILIEQNADYLAGSRIKMMNTKIHRSGFRHFVGRIIATTIDSRYKLGIYDTQCGAKLFRTTMAPVFEAPFTTTWFFDVELFLRIRKQMPAAVGIEQPLDQWTDKGSRHLSVWSFPVIVKQILSLFNKYPAH